MRTAVLLMMFIMSCEALVRPAVAQAAGKLWVSGDIDDTVFYSGIFPESGTPTSSAGNVLVGDRHSAVMDVELHNGALSVVGMSGLFDHVQFPYDTTFGFTNPSTATIEVSTFGADRVLALPYERFSGVEGVRIEWFGYGKSGPLPANINYYLYLFGNPGSLLDSNGALKASTLQEFQGALTGAILQLHDNYPEYRAFDVDAVVRVVPEPPVLGLMLGYGIAVTKRRRRLAK